MKFPLSKLKESKLGEEMHEIFHPSSLEAAGISSRFIQRSGKLSAEAFVNMCVFQPHEARQCSLEESCEYLNDHYDIEMQKQSLDERFNDRSSLLLRGLLGKLLANHLSPLGHLESLSDFQAIRITDATGFNLPTCCEDVYQGSGGAASSAQAKLYLDYDLLSGQFKDLSLHSGLHSDGKYHQIKAEVAPGELVLDDLGFFDLRYCRAISETGAYFLHRYKSRTQIHQKNAQEGYQRIQPLELLKGVNNLCSFEVAVGEQKLPVRLIVEPIPAQAYKSRLQRLKKETRKKGRVLTAERIELARYNLFITNTPEEKLPLRWVRLLYTLRWQIELLFKIFKSIFHIDKIHQMHRYRFECILYGKLMAIVLAWKIYFTARNLVYPEIELSEWKGFKMIKRKLKKIRKAITKGPRVCREVVIKIVKRVCEKSKKEVKNDTESMIDGKKLTPLNILFHLNKEIKKDKEFIINVLQT